ncbi:MAG: sugar ABC transporter ATP-binding protein [Clostridiales bacterium]|nr:sugar ABC transporter ATP-binding protein [Clostridiales bacterium]
MAMADLGTTREPIIEVRHLRKTYSGITVLKDVNFRLYPGEVNALVGENGAGKSTMIKIIAGVEKPDRLSEIYFDGVLIHNMTPSRAMQFGIAVIYQDLSMFPNLSIAENLFIGRNEGALFSRREIVRKAVACFRDVNIEIDPCEKLGNLSVGQQQIVAIVKAVSSSAKVIIMDEPTASLTGNEIELLFRLVRELKKKNIAIVYISHKLDEVLALADTVTILRDGELIASDGVSNFDYQKIVRLMVGRELRFISMRSEKEPGEMLFEVKHLKNSFVNDVSFAVRRNEILGLTGLVGAGRSEMGQSIFGIYPLEAGEILIWGERVSIRDTSEAIKSGISYLTEDRQTQGMFKGQTLIWNSTAAIIDRLSNSMHTMDFEKEREIVADNIRALQIRPNRPEMNVESLSGGNQQKVMIAKWLNTKPKVLLIDEPTCGVDVGTKLEIHRLLRELAEQGVAVILISSDLTEVLAISDRILVMREGRIVGTFDAADATMENILSKGLMG